MEEAQDKAFSDIWCCIAVGNNLLYHNINEVIVIAGGSLAVASVFVVSQ